MRHRMPARRSVTARPNASRRVRKAASSASRRDSIPTHLVLGGGAFGAPHGGRLAALATNALAKEAPRVFPGPLPILHLPLEESRWLPSRVSSLPGSLRA